MHNCQFIVSFRTEPGEDGDPVFCDAPASIKHGDAWLCAEHYDYVLETPSTISLWFTPEEAAEKWGRKAIDKNRLLSIMYESGL